MLSTSRNRIHYGTIGSLFIILLCLLFAFSDYLSSWQWLHIELHSTIETLGGISAIMIALVLFQEARKLENQMLVMLSTGFICMGVLDIFHAMSRPGDAFIFLHSVASLAGGFFFALIWLPKGLILKNLSEQRWIVYGAVILSISVGLRALFYPGDVPKIIPLYDGQFTLAATLINTIASLLFLVSVPKFYSLYLHDKHVQTLLFMYLALLFGIAEMIFQLSNTWNGIWWLWHLIRFTAFMITLGIVFYNYRYLSQDSGKRHYNDRQKKQ